MTTMQFSGFPKACLDFFQALEADNNREWFQSNKSIFETNVLEPARQYVVAMGERLAKVAPGIHAVPMIDKSIFRIHRDVRFSPDKRPFKTHLGIFLWEGDAPKLECPGFYIHFDKNKLLIGGGLHIFSKTQLPRYRERVDHERFGRQLEQILTEGKKHFPSPIASDAAKRVPRGYPQDHPRAELLKQKGVTLGEETPIPDALHTKDALDYIYERFEKILPLHRWLRAV